MEKSRKTLSADFAIELAEDFRARFPPGSQSEGASAKALARALDEVCTRARDFQQQHRLGFFAKAKFGTEFKYRLEDLGYPESFADELTRTLLIRMSGK